MTQAALARKLARLNRGVGEAIGPAFRRVQSLAADPGTAHDILAEEQDRRREYLAEELLKIFAEEADPYHFTDTHADTREEGKDYSDSNPTVTVSEWAEKLAHAALAAATVLYPEIPEPNVGADTPNFPPAAAVEGARSVAPDPDVAPKGGVE